MSDALKDGALIKCRCSSSTKITHCIRVCNRPFRLSTNGPKPAERTPFVLPPPTHKEGGVVTMPGAGFLVSASRATQRAAAGRATGNPAHLGAHESQPASRRIDSIGGPARSSEPAARAPHRGLRALRRPQRFRRRTRARQVARPAGAIARATGARRDGRGGMGWWSDAVRRKAGRSPGLTG
jgi:hypothetical protein